MGFLFSFAICVVHKMCHIVMISFFVYFCRAEEDHFILQESVCKVCIDLFLRENMSEVDYEKLAEIGKYFYNTSNCICVELQVI